MPPLGAVPDGVVDVELVLVGFPPEVSVGLPVEAAARGAAGGAAAEHRADPAWQYGSAAAATEAIAAAGANPGDRRGSARERLAEIAHGHRRFVLAEEDRLPVHFVGDGIDVFLAQETDVVGFDEGVGVGRIGMERSVIELNSAAVLHAAMIGFKIAVALDGFGNLRRGDGQRNDDKRHEEDGDQHHVAFFGGLHAPPDWYRFPHSSVLFPRSLSSTPYPWTLFPALFRRTTRRASACCCRRDP